MALFLEYEDVMKRPEQAIGHGMQLPAIDSMLASFAALTEAVDVYFQWRPQLRCQG